jgi:hypothetical protein
MTEEEKDGSSQGSHESEKSNDDDSDKNEENEHEPQEDKKKKPSALSNPKVRIGLIILGPLGSVSGHATFERLPVDCCLLGESEETRVICLC